MKKLHVTNEKAKTKNICGALVLALLMTPALISSSSQAQASSLPIEDGFINVTSEIHSEGYFGFEDEFEGIISNNDWETLSQAQIDAKLKAAGKETFGDPQDPLYNLTPAQIDKLTDAEWEKIEEQYEKLYGIEAIGVMDFSLIKDDIIKEIEESYNAIKNDLPLGTRQEIEKSMKTLSSLDEKAFFETIEEMYELATPQLDEYYMNLGGAEKASFVSFPTDLDDTITLKDWETLSFAQIDAKLKAAGKEAIGDPQDPLYNLTPAQIEKLTDAEWEKIEEQYNELYGFDEDFGFEDEFEGIISNNDWETLSQAQIDAKLKAAGKETFGDPQDPLYNLTPAQIDKLTDAEWEKIEEQYEKMYGEEFDDDYIDGTFDFGFEDEFEGIISNNDWETLSQAQIDAKLKAAGKETFGDPQDPLYNLTPAQIDKLTDAEWEKIEKQYEKMYFNTK